MSTYVALLRGINVGGRGQIRMEDLRRLFVDLGYRDAQTYIQSGNVVFGADSADEARLAAQIEEGIREQVGVSAAVLLRTTAELFAVAAANPFAKRVVEPTKLLVTFLARQPEPERAAAFDRPAGTAEELALKGRELFLYCPDGYGRAKLNGAYVERRLGVPTTTRNWRVVNALLDLMLARDK